VSGAGLARYAATAFTSAAFQRSTSLASGDLAGAVERYNARVNEYNARCADRPRDPVLLGRVQATLSCPPSY
jgi:hypothetical protein